MKVTGAQALFSSLEGEGVEVVFGDPRRRDPAGLRPADRLERPPRPVPPRAGRRPRGRGLRLGHRQGRRVHRHLAARAAATWSRRSPTRRWTRSRSSRSPARSRRRWSATTPSRRPTSPASRCRSRSTTSWSRTRRPRRGGPRGVPHRAHRPPGPGARRPAEGRAVSETDVEVAGRRSTLPGYKPTTKGNHAQVARGGEADPEGEAAGAVRRRRRDQGRGQRRSCSSWRPTGELPVVTTLMARGAFPDAHELCLGMPGMHGNYTAVTAMQKSDLLIALGARFDDRVTGKLAGVRAGRQDRSTSTSTRPRSARTARPTCRSWATART